MVGRIENSRQAMVDASLKEREQMAMAGLMEWVDGE